MNKDKQITLSGSKTPVQLYGNGLNSGSLIEQAVRGLSEEQAQNLMVVAAEKVLDLEVKGREQLIDHEFGRKSAEDHVELFNNLDKQGKMTRQHIVSDIKTGAGNMRIESKSGATCFVASVAYDDPNHPDVMWLRWYRDNMLCYSKIGRRFIDWYWRCGPKIAKVVDRSLILRRGARFGIAQIVRLLRMFVVKGRD
ncbi:MAG: hypothetical protein PHW66_03770 [Gallionella sp.]|nr:hypothetical protein [Gallionella sp.]